MSDPAPRISLATLADVDALTGLETVLFHTDRCSRRSFIHLIKHGDVVVVRDQADTLCGYAILLRRSNSKKIRIYSFGIVAAMRRRGVAAALLQELERVALACGRHTLTLEVGDGNLAAIDFYKKHGFRQYGFRLGYYEDGGHAILMKKALLPPPSP